MLGNAISNKKNYFRAIRACPHFFFQMVIVGIVNIDRNRDYTPTYAPEQPGNLQFPTSGKADKFTRFLSSDLIPYIDSHYKTQPYRILAGWSLGGLFTVHTFFENPQLFSAYLAVSPSLWWDKDMYVKRTETILSSGKISNKPLTVTVGTLEGGDIGRSVRDGFVRVMKEKLRQDLSKFK
jgi:predicted alpha/beta superfamily hydrolase